MKGVLPLCVVDANIILDLRVGRIVGILFRLPYYMLTTSFVKDELGPQEWARMSAQGLELHALSSEDLLNVRELHARHPGCSRSDISVLVLAERLKAILLTGDRRLRNLADERGLDCHGTLWVLDTVLDENLLAPYVAGLVLQRIKQHKGRRLPEEECNQRLARWLSGKR